MQPCVSNPPHSRCVVASFDTYAEAEVFVNKQLHTTRKKQWRGRIRIRYRHASGRFDVLGVSA